MGGEGVVMFLNRRMKLLRALATIVVLMSAASCIAQQTSQEKMAFDVASVRQDRSNVKPSSNIALGPGAVWGPNGGVLSAKNFPLLQYVAFAYRLTDYQEAALREKLPEWALTERFDVEARTANQSVTKDQMRLMMQGLLAERFGLTEHYETRTVAVYALELVRPGALGPKLEQHPADAVCPNFSLLEKTADDKPMGSLPDAGSGGFPTFCGSILGVPASAQDRYSFGARDVSMSVIANSFSSWGNLGRPVVDRTELAGKYDFVLDFTPDPRPKYATVDSGGPGFEEALKKELGLKLEAEKGQVEFLVVDHLDDVTAN
jgi:uncharacterized protein (TIGR03435 family)